ncbi:MAG: leucine-rich repeat protein [Prevotella sp.]
MFTNNSRITSFDEFKYFTKARNPERGIFDNCSKLKRISLPDRFSLAHSMFASCTSLETVTFPEKMRPSEKELYETFAYCTSLKVLDFPETFTGIINSGTFREVTAILVFRSKTVVKFKRYADWMFYYKGHAIYVPDNLVESYKTTDGWNDKAECIRPLSKYQG